MGFVTAPSGAVSIGEVLSGSLHGNGERVLIFTLEQWLNSIYIHDADQTMLVREARPFLAKSDGASVMNFGSIGAAFGHSGRWT